MRMGLKEGTCCSRVRKVLLTVSLTVSHHSDTCGMNTTLGVLRRASRKTCERHRQVGSVRAAALPAQVRVDLPRAEVATWRLLPERRTPPASSHWPSRASVNPGSGLTASPGGAAGPGLSGCWAPSLESRPEGGGAGTQWAVEEPNWSHKTRNNKVIIKVRIYTVG